MKLDIALFVKESRKFVVAIVNAAATLVSVGLLHGQVEYYTVLGIQLAAALGIYAVRNQPPKKLVQRAQKIP